MLLHEDVEIVDSGFCDKVRRRLAEPGRGRPRRGRRARRDQPCLVVGEGRGRCLETRGSSWTSAAAATTWTSVDGLLMVLSPWAVAQPALRQRALHRLPRLRRRHLLPGARRGQARGRRRDRRRAPHQGRRTATARRSCASNRPSREKWSGSGDRRRGAEFLPKGRPGGADYPVCKATGVAAARSDKELPRDITARSSRRMIDVPSYPEQRRGVQRAPQSLHDGGTLARSMERLSSGYRINRAADDAAGLAISERLRGQIGGLEQAQRNVQDAVSLVQTAEGSLTEVHAMLQRVRELAVQYKNGSLSDADRTAIQSEVNQLASEIERIGSSAEFNGIKLLNAARARSPSRSAREDGQTISVSTISLGWQLGAAHHLLALARSNTDIARDRHGDRQRVRSACRLRCGAEPPRVHAAQRRDLPGEPDGFGEPHPRRGHGRGDGRTSRSSRSCSKPALRCWRRRTSRARAFFRSFARPGT